MQQPLLQLLQSRSHQTTVLGKTRAYLDTPSDLSEPYVGSQNIITVHIGDRPLKVPLREVLDAFWTTHLDSPCMVCSGSFNDETGPPMRTISSDQDTQSSRLLQLRIHNRHFHCLDKHHWKNIVPISHAWHDPVAAAHTTYHSSDTAIAHILGIPSRALKAVQYRFGSGIEIWHDYISVPQWRYDIQQSLLHMLPVIFSKAERSVMHLHDVSTDVVTRITKSRPNIVPPLETIAEYMRSNWYQRMWVSLECSCSPRAYILSEESEVCNVSFKGIEARMADHVTTHQSSHDRADFLAKCRELGFDHLSVGSLSNIWRIKERLTLGAVYDILARKKCRTYRDRFIVTTAFLNQEGYKEAVAALPNDTTEACLYVSRRCLENGDYTPLLLAPSLHNQEAEVPGARWLRGHESMSVLTWRLGRILRDARDPAIIREGRIMPRLEVVGDITRWEYFPFGSASPVEAFSTLMDWILSTSGTSELQFLATIPRIYHFHSWNHITPLPSFQGLGRRLARYKSLDPLNENTQEERFEIALEIVDLLKLSERTNSGPSLIQYTAIMEERYFVDKHALVIVRCPQCGRKAVQRVALWHAPTGPARLYRIPGLSFWRTVANGVGLVMEGTRVIGRMIYGIPTCECRQLELVEIN